MSDTPKLETVPVVALGAVVLFPLGRVSVDVTGPSWAAIYADRKNGHFEPVYVAVELDGQPANVGVLAGIERLSRNAQGGFRATILGLQRHQLHSITQTAPVQRGQVEPLVETPFEPEARAELAPQLEKLRESTQRLLDDAPETGRGMRVPLGAADDAGLAADVVGAMLDLSTAQRLSILAEPDAGRRVAMVQELVDGLAERAAATRPDPAVREEVLRAKLREIQAELGEDEDDLESGDDALLTKVRDAKLPPDVRALVDKQVRRLKAMGDQAPESSGTRAYLELLVELPWDKRSPDVADLAEVRRILDAEHAGLDRLKKRIVEDAAVRGLNPGRRSPILCLVGPPGVGKTSLGKAIAKALGRQYVRASLGGVSDESEIRGHRRTYIGALPGRIIDGLKRAGTKNPVFVLDEVDKLADQGRGDPSAALLEVLDPAQNDTFSDHFLELPFDLSEVLFIATANDLDAIPLPLRDRMEIVELSGYTVREKRAIARQHLVPRQLVEHGLAADQVTLSDAGLDEVIEGHTHESGVRKLEQQIAAIVRALTVKVAAGEPIDAVLGPVEVQDVLGSAPYEPPSSFKIEDAGIVMGLAATGAGGDVMVLEATRMAGQGRLSLTGRLGSVMKESAQTAHSWVRAHATELGIPLESLATQDLHVHAPSGGVPKEGPSAGVALVTALTSSLSGRYARTGVAMTGEVTLRGHVLPVGGVLEKLLAAHRAGIHTVILPRRNAPDTRDLPLDVKNDLELVYVDRVEEALDVALEPVGVAHAHGHWPALAA